MPERRSIALLGFGPTNSLAPWYDKTWSIWTMNNAPAVFAGHFDVLFEMHTKAVRDNERTYRLTKWTDERIAELARRIPVWTLDASIPGTKRFPLDIMRAYFPRGTYSTSSISWMMALAIYTIETQGTEYEKRIGVWGIELQASAEYAKERGCFEYWAGLAEGRGIAVISPIEAPILSSPYMYGYDAEKVERLKATVAGRQRELDNFIEQGEEAVRRAESATLSERLKLERMRGMRIETAWVLETETDAKPEGLPFS